VSRVERVGRCCLLLESGADGGPIGRLVGELDLFNAGELPDVLCPVLASPGAVLDLDRVTFVDLTAARVLLSLVGAPVEILLVASPGTPCARVLAWLVGQGEERARGLPFGRAAEAWRL
jgi:hypothetical protein